MVQIVRKSILPEPGDVPEHLVVAAQQARSMGLREPRPSGFPLFFTSDWQLIEPAVAYLHEHFVQRAHTTDTLRTYTEILYDWFETLEQNVIAWSEADAVNLAETRHPSRKTERLFGDPKGPLRSAWSVKMETTALRDVAVKMSAVI